MKDVMDRVESTRTPLDKLLEAVPGYKSYRNKEERREADKIQREFLARKLEEGKHTIDNVKEELLGDGVLDGLEELDNLNKLVDQNANRLRYASYGEGGLFDTVRVELEDLEKMHAFDLALVEVINRVLEGLAKLGGLKEKELLKEIKAARAGLEQFSKHFDQRENMLKGVA